MRQTLATARNPLPLIPLTSIKQSGSRSSVAHHQQTAILDRLSSILSPSYLPLATNRDGDVDEAASVQVALVGAALGGLGLLLGLNLETGRAVC
jgi:hypothetical protein